jgi:hypothetical protein
VKWELKFMESRMKSILALKYCKGSCYYCYWSEGSICIGDGGCASWGGVQVGFASWGGQVRVVELVYSSWGVKGGVCRSSIVNSWFPSSMEKASPPLQGK